MTGTDRILALLEVEGLKAIYELSGALGLVGWIRDVPQDIIDLAVPVPVTMATPLPDQGEWTLAWTGGVGPFEVHQAASAGAPWVRLGATDERSTRVPAAGTTSVWQVRDRVGQVD